MDFDTIYVVWEDCILKNVVCNEIDVFESELCIYVNIWKWVRIVF